MATPLDPDGRPVEVAADVWLETPGLAGVADLFYGGGEDSRSATRVSSNFEAALASTGVTDELTIIIDGAAEVPMPAAGGAMRSTAHSESAFVAEVPGPAEGFEQVVLYVDEAGAATWCVAQPDGVAESEMVHRGGSRRRYVVPKRVPRSADGGDRGIFGWLGRKVLKVLAFKAIDAVAGAVGDHFVSRWEAAHRPHRVRSFTPEDYASAGSDLTEPDWARLAAGPALLFVHGTFSRSDLAFAELPSATLAMLAERYGGRVFAFDHPTASVTPDRNVEELLARVPAGVELDVDIVCHSRGGLVSRVLAERHLTGPLRVRNLVFVATPNAGTVLADPRHMGTFVDTVTTALSFFPDNGVTDVLEIVVSVLKQVAVGALGGLDGLQSMNPRGDWLQQLNVATDATACYRAIAADFEPTEAGLVEFSKDRLVDAVFYQAPNDLVVPTAGVAGPNGSSAFPIADALLLPAERGVWHSGYFSQAEVIERLDEWLPGS